MAVSKRQIEERKMRQERILTGALEVFKTKGGKMQPWRKFQKNLGLERQRSIIISNQKKKFSLKF